MVKLEVISYFSHESVSLLTRVLCKLGFLQTKVLYSIIEQKAVAQDKF